jgi:hypothetical protein
MNRLADKSIAELIQYAHYSFGSPPATRMEKAIKAGFLINVPGLNIERYRKHLPCSIVTTSGHQERRRKSKTTLNASHQLQQMMTAMMGFFPECISERTHECFFTAVSRTEFHSMHEKSTPTKLGSSRYHQPMGTITS